jgi:hypothetical protein
VADLDHLPKAVESRHARGAGLGGLVRVSLHRSRSFPLDTPAMPSEGGLVGPQDAGNGGMM